MDKKDKRIETIKEMRRNRYTFAAIAKTLGISRARVYQILYRWDRSVVKKRDK